MPGANQIIGSLRMGRRGRAGRGPGQAAGDFHGKEKVYGSIP
jgi:hypothetical protein